MTAPDVTTMTGLERLRRVEDESPSGRPSLIGGLIGTHFDEVDHGRVVMSATTRPDLADPLGAVHGGIAATLLDSVRPRTTTCLLLPTAG